MEARPWPSATQWMTRPPHPLEPTERVQDDRLLPASQTAPRAPASVSGKRQKRHWASRPLCSFATFAPIIAASTPNTIGRLPTFFRAIPGSAHLSVAHSRRESARRDSKLHAVLRTLGQSVRNRLAKEDLRNQGLARLPLDRNRSSDEKSRQLDKLERILVVFQLVRRAL